MDNTDSHCDVAASSGETGTVYGFDKVVNLKQVRSSHASFGDGETVVRFVVRNATPKPDIIEPAPPPPRNARKAEVAMGSLVELQHVAWLWKGWLAHGKLHIFAGRPGSLKTTTALDFAAAITSGGKWPDGSAASHGKVLMWSGEDAINDTLLPRFVAAGGDRENIAFVTGTNDRGKRRAFDPATDIPDLAQVCADLGGVNLVIIDPMVAVATKDSHKNAETRRDLSPLVALAEETQAAVLGIHHLTKRSEGADPVDRVSGSLAFGAGPRVVLLNALDRNAKGETRGVLMRAKNNLGPTHGGFEFAAETRPLDDYPTISAQRIHWGQCVDESADEILERLEARASDKPCGKAGVYLREALKDGPRIAAELIEEAKAQGINERTLRRTLKSSKLGGFSSKAGFGKGWIWELPKKLDA